MRALLLIGLAVIFTTPSLASAQSFYGLFGHLTFAAPAHRYVSSEGPLAEKIDHGFIRRPRWSAEHVILATTSTTFILLDWITTADAIRRCQQPQTVCTPSVEQNPLLGRSPSLSTLRTWSLVGISANLVGGALLKKRWMRSAWFATVTTAEFLIVRHNVRAGLHFNLKL